MHERDVKKIITKQKKLIDGHDRKKTEDSCSLKKKNCVRCLPFAFKPVAQQLWLLIWWLG